MPTGYTAKIENGIDFPEFAMDCARAFGACIMLRDEPGGGEVIPEKFEPSDYHAKAIERTKEDIRRLQLATPEYCERAAEEEYATERSQVLTAMRKNAELSQKYEAMLAKVLAWQPPTPEHKGLKDFMESQIRESIAFDCGSEYYTERLSALRRKTGEEWKRDEFQRLNRDLGYHSRKHAEEVERTNARTEWVRQLRESLREVSHELA